MLLWVTLGWGEQTTLWRSSVLWLQSCRRLLSWWQRWSEVPWWLQFRHIIVKVSEACLLVRSFLWYHEVLVFPVCFAHDVLNHLLVFWFFFAGEGADAICAGVLLPFSQYPLRCLRVQWLLTGHSYWFPEFWRCFTLRATWSDTTMEITLTIHWVMWVSTPLSLLLERIWAYWWFLKRTTHLLF